MLKNRIITASILIPFLLGCIFYLPNIVFLALMLVLVVLASTEWVKFGTWKKKPIIIAYHTLLALLFLAISLDPSPAIYYLALFWWGLAGYWLWYYPKSASNFSKPFAFGFFGSMVIVPPAATFVYLQGDGLQGKLWLLCFLLMVWLADTSAYFAGRRFGKKKLVPLVSPGKTREGLYAALFFGFLFGILLALLWRFPWISWPFWLFFSIVIVLMSVLGDLTESMFKRNAGIKDSGNILPGHGGLLDRIDGITASAPIMMLLYPWLDLISGLR